MTKVWCGALDCKHNKDNMCKQKEINLSNGIVGTMWQGSMQYWKCLSYEESNLSKEFRQLISKVGERKSDGI